ncbi:MAG: hypothetical protein FWC43_10340 [Planctomycetaceae bacterium]|nr:hypothetical protein [Planctomycetaceae bacterium]
MKRKKVLKFKGIGNRESGIGNWRKFFTYRRFPIPDSRFPMPLTVLSYHLFTSR